LREKKEELAEHEISVLVVTFQQLEFAKKYVTDTGLEFPLLIDTERTLYNAYDMPRGSMWRILNPFLWGTYLRLMKKDKAQKPTDDIYQLGGDILISPEQKIALNFVSHDPVDRPSIDSILEKVDEAK